MQPHPNQPKDAYPPADEKAERLVLGAMLVLGSLHSQGDPDESKAASLRHDRLTSRLLPSDFSRQWHRRVFQAILRCRQRGDYGGYAVARALEAPEWTTQDRSDLVGLLAESDTLIAAEQDAEQLVELGVRRELLRLAGQCATWAYEQRNPDDALAAALQEIGRIRSRLRRDTPTDNFLPLDDQD